MKIFFGEEEELRNRSTSYLEMGSSPPIRIHAMHQSQFVDPTQCLLINSCSRSYTMPFNLDADFLEGVTSFLTDGREFWIGEVQDQDGTHCCYGFACSDAIYTLQYREFGKAEKVSIQEYFDRLHEVHPPKNAVYKDGKIVLDERGFGNSAQNAFDYASVHGIAFDVDWPFKKLFSTAAEREQLKYITENGRRLFLTGYDVIGSRDHQLVCQKLLEQPVTALVYGCRSLREWKHSDGVYQGPTEEEMDDLLEAKANNADLPFNYHVMLLVGYGDDAEGGEYYLAKDSNGDKSGYHGFYKIAQKACRKFAFPIGCRMRDRKEKAETSNTGPKAKKASKEKSISKKKKSK